MSSVSAANKLRDRVLKEPGMVLMSTSGRPDVIIRFQKIPDNLQQTEFKKKTDSGHEYVFLNLDWGPAQEAWRTASREVFHSARRDRPIPEPLSVSPDSKEDWAVDVEDVPIIENAIVSSTATPVSHLELYCGESGCSFVAKTETGLKIHKSKHK